METEPQGKLSSQGQIHDPGADPTDTTNAVRRSLRLYAKQCDFYDAAARLCHERIKELLDANGIRVAVTYRAKDRVRLESKLQKRAELERAEFPENRQISGIKLLRRIKDLAGVRIAAYFPGDMEQIGRIIEENFDQVEKVKRFPRNPIDRETPSGYTKRFDGYRAHHYRVRFKPADPARDQDRYGLAVIEIQVASVLMHAWAEVEHDLVYKPYTGELSAEEYMILDEINGLILAGELALERLQAAITTRLKETGSRFNSQFELGNFLAKSLEIDGQIMSEKMLTGDLRRLLKILQASNLDTPQGVSDLISQIQSEGAVNPKTFIRSIENNIIDSNPDIIRLYFEGAFSQPGSFFEFEQARHISRVSVEGRRLDTLYRRIHDQLLVQLRRHARAAGKRRKTTLDSRALRDTIGLSPDNISKFEVIQRIYRELAWYLPPPERVLAAAVSMAAEILNAIQLLPYSETPSEQGVEAIQEEKQQGEQAEDENGEG